MTKSIPILTSIAVSALISLATIAPKADAQVILNEDFESMSLGSINGQNGWTTAGTAAGTSIADIQAVGSSQALYLEDSDSGKAPKANYYLGQDITSGYIEFDINYTGRSSALALYLFTGNDSTSDSRVGMITVVPEENKGLQLVLEYEKNNIKQSTLIPPSTASYLVDGWNTLRFVFDKEAQTASLLVNGNSVAGLALQDILFPEGWSIGTIQFIAGANSSTTAKGYIDNVVVFNQTAIPEPASATLILGVLTGAAFCLRRRVRR